MDIDKRQKELIVNKAKFPTPPNQALVELWPDFLTVAKTAIKSLDVPLDIICGNYLSDLKVMIYRYSALPNECVLFNLRRLEFFIDLLEFTDYPSDLHFQFFFSKYIRDFYTEENKEWWSFFEYQKNQCRSAVNHEHLEINLHKACMGEVFTILHEIFHRKQDEIQIAREMIESGPFKSAYQASNFSDDPDKKILETSCDFWAIAISFSVLFTKTDTAPYEINDYFEIALFDLILGDLYCRMVKIGLDITAGTYIDIKESEEIKLMNERIQPLILMTKISSNTKMVFFDRIDFEKVKDSFGNKITVFFMHFSKYLKQCQQLLDEYNKLPKEKKPTFSSAYSSGNIDDIWLYHDING